jgi:hypothetical protein
MVFYGPRFLDQHNPNMYGGHKIGRNVMTEAPAYQVLARKYRPETFADLVGQDAMVQTLRNAFEADRIAQAFFNDGHKRHRQDNYC